jgi:hypothetical protein
MIAKGFATAFLSYNSRREHFNSNRRHTINSENTQQIETDFQSHNTVRDTLTYVQYWSRKLDV